MIKKAQSAMEYLMTYGWSILLIAIVIAAVYALGVFNNNPLSSSNTCLAQSGYLCTKPLLNSTGVLNVTFGQSYGTTYTITGVACTNSSSAPSFLFIRPITLGTGQATSMDFRCPVTSSSIGTAFSGYLWIQYNTATLSSQQAKVTILNAKITTTSGLGTSAVVGSFNSIPITLTNLQSTSTGTSFSQMLVINSAQYQTSITPTWSNVEFTTGPNGGGTVLQAWIESNATNTASHTIVWVNLASAIAATSSATVYMNFMSNTVLSASGPTGEAPQLSCTTTPSTTPPACTTGYAQYDNGASVFTHYDNFAGNTLNAFWATTFEPANILVNNGIIFTDGRPYILGGSFNPQQSVADFDMYYTGLSVPNFVIAGWTNSGNLQPAVNTGSSSYQLTNEYTGISTTLFTGGSTTSYNVFSIWQGASATFGGLGYNIISLSGNYLSLTNADPFVSAAAGGLSSSMVMQWFRVRPVPPSGVMPSQVTGLATPSQIVHYVPITLTNSQSSSTSANLQTNITFNAGAYQLYESSALQNIEFYYPNGTVIHSWMEGNMLNEQQTTNLYTSNTIMYWLKIAPQIAASGGIQTIYLGFASNSLNLLSTGTTGEAPQLSGTYGQYDNGATVFNTYDNFVGSSLSGQWTASIPAGTAVTVNNGVTMNGMVSGGSGVGIIATSSTSIPFLAEAYFTTLVTGIGATEGFGVFNGVSGTGIYFLNGYPLRAGGAQFGCLSTSYDSTPNFPSAPAVAGIGANPGANVITEPGYSAYVHNTLLTSIGITTTNIGIGDACNAQGGSLTAKWVRVRSYPPNGVTPSQSFGTFT